MKLHTTSLTLSETPLISAQEKQLLASPNAMSAFIFSLDDPTKLPESTYLTLTSQYGRFLGAVHMEMGEHSLMVNIHPMLLERDREYFSHATELAILYAEWKNMTPFARVLNTSQYSYMHKFLENLGMISKDTGQWIIYTLPPGWQPKSFEIFYVDLRS